MEKLLHPGIGGRPKMTKSVQGVLKGVFQPAWTLRKFANSWSVQASQFANADHRDREMSGQSRGGLDEDLAIDGSN